MTRREWNRSHTGSLFIAIFVGTLAGGFARHAPQFDGWQSWVFAFLVLGAVSEGITTAAWWFASDGGKLQR